MSEAPSTAQVRLVADVAVLAQGGVVLVRYADPSRYDGETGWFLPDDLIRQGEHPDRAARRIVKEQVGIGGRPALSFLESLAGEPWHLVFHYVLRPSTRSRLAPSPALLDARWFDVAALPRRAEVAHHGWGLDVLRRVGRTSARPGARRRRARPPAARARGSRRARRTAARERADRHGR